jgi:membrane associated rhomboid family serine protease
MIPVRDANKSHSFPIVTVILIGLNALVWLFEASLGPNGLEMFVKAYGFVPAHFLNFSDYPGGFLGNALIPIFASLFMHGSWMHVIGNMWFLWIFGDNVEDRLGHGTYLLFYLLCGVAASMAHLAFNPESVVPTVGASGAVSGVLGAYIIKFPRARILTVIPSRRQARYARVPAYLFIGLWIAFQFVRGVASLGVYDENAGGVAYWAHIGGFFIGMALFYLIPERRLFRELEVERPKGEIV